MASPPPAPVATPPPAPAHAGMTVQEPERERGNVVKIIGMVGAIVVMVVVALGLIFMAMKSWSSKGSATTQASPASKPNNIASMPATSAHAAKPSEDVAQPANPLASVTERVADMKSKVIESRQEGAEITGDRPPEASSRPAPAATPPPQPSPPPRAEPAATASAGGSAAPVQAQEFSLWPRVTVNGILAKGTRGRGMAIINNQMMSVNESVEGVRLVEVKGQGVTLEFGGEVRFVEIGQTVQ